MIKTALVIGIIATVIDVFILSIICFVVNHSKISVEQKKSFNDKLFGNGPKYRIKFIIFIVLANLLVEFFVADMVLSEGPDAWKEYKLESTKIYYSGEIFEMSPIIKLVFDDDIRSEEKEYIIVKYEEIVKATDKAPFGILFKALHIERKTGRVEYHITSVYWRWKK